MNSLIRTHVIDIPAGTRFVQAIEIPGWIADSLHPVPDGLPVLCDLVKRTQVEPANFRNDELTPEDWGLLDEIWRDLPHIRWATPDTFEKYLAAFYAAPNRPDWRPYAQYKDPKQDANDERANARNQQFWNIDAAIKSGELKALTAQRTPASALSHDCIVSVDNARRYLEPLGFELREVVSQVAMETTAIDAPTDEAGTPVRLTISPNPKASIDAHIARRAREIFDAGEASGKGSIARIIEAELRTAGHRGERGDYLSAATIEKAIPTGLTGGRAGNGRKA